MVCYKSGRDHGISKDFLEKLVNYRRIPITPTFRGNRIRFELSGVENK